MNRRQFMKELGSGLAEAFREAAVPMVEKDVAKLTRLADMLSGYSYHKVTLPAAGPRMDMVEGHPVLLYRSSRDWRAYSALCPGCGQLMHYLVHAESLKCFGCDTDYQLVGDARLVRYPVRLEKGEAQLGLPRKGTGTCTSFR